jgi:hypothetical protein
MLRRTDFDALLQSRPEVAEKLKNAYQTRNQEIQKRKEEEEKQKKIEAERIKEEEAREKEKRKREAAMAVRSMSRRNSFATGGPSGLIGPGLSGSGATPNGSRQFGNSSREIRTANLSIGNEINVADRPSTPTDQQARPSGESVISSAGEASQGTLITNLAVILPGGFDSVTSSAISSPMARSLASGTAINNDTPENRKLGDMTAARSLPIADDKLSARPLGLYSNALSGSCSKGQVGGDDSPAESPRCDHSGIGSNGIVDPGRGNQPPHHTISISSISASAVRTSDGGTTTDGNHNGGGGIQVGPSAGRASHSASSSDADAPPARTSRLMPRAPSWTKAVRLMPVLTTIVDSNSTQASRQSLVSASSKDSDETADRDSATKHPNQAQQKPVPQGETGRLQAFSAPGGASRSAGPGSIFTSDELGELLTHSSISGSNVFENSATLARPRDDSVRDDGSSDSGFQGVILSAVNRFLTSDSAFDELSEGVDAVSGNSIPQFGGNAVIIQEQPEDSDADSDVDPVVAEVRREAKLANRFVAPSPRNDARAVHAAPPWQGDFRSELPAIMVSDSASELQVMSEFAFNDAGTAGKRQNHQRTPPTPAPPSSERPRPNEGQGRQTITSTSHRVNPGGSRSVEGPAVRELRQDADSPRRSSPVRFGSQIRHEQSIVPITVVAGDSWASDLEGPGPPRDENQASTELFHSLNEL